MDESAEVVSRSTARSAAIDLAEASTVVRKRAPSGRIRIGESEVVRVEAAANAIDDLDPRHIHGRLFARTGRQRSLARRPNEGRSKSRDADRP